MNRRSPKMKNCNVVAQEEHVEGRKSRWNPPRTIFSRQRSSDPRTSASSVTPTSEPWCTRAATHTEPAGNMWGSYTLKGADSPLWNSFEDSRFFFFCCVLLLFKNRTAPQWLNEVLWAVTENELPSVHCDSEREDKWLLSGFFQELFMPSKNWNANISVWIKKLLPVSVSQRFEGNVVVNNIHHNSWW